MKFKMKKTLSVLLAGAMIFGTASTITFADNDGTTDSTKVETKVEVEQVTNRIDILTVNDFHGSVEEYGKNVGMAKMVGYVNDQRALNPNTIVVSGGDNYQGSAVSNLTMGAPVTEMFKGMGLVASAVGNHEFDWGVDNIEQWGKDGGFPYLAANIYDKTTGEPVAWAKPYMIQECAGKKIAFVGLSTAKTAFLTKAENVDTLEFKSAAEGAKIWVDFLKAGKAEEGTPDIIIALTHVPSVHESKYDFETPVIGEELDKLTQVEGIDAVITGHSHETVFGKMNGVPVVQAYKNGRAMGKLAIELNEDGTVKSIEPSVTALYKLTNDLLIPSEDAAASLQKFVEEVEPITNVEIGELVGEMPHSKGMKNLTPLGYWCSDVMRKAAGVQIGITNGGGLRVSLEEGKITMGDMYDVMPFDNTMFTMDVTGEHLKRIIDHGIDAPEMGDGQFAGLKVVIDSNKPYEHRIKSLMLEDGTPIEDDKLYSIVTSDFLSGYKESTGTFKEISGDKYSFLGATNAVNTYIPMRDAFADAFKAGTVTAPSIEGIIVDEPTKTMEYTIESGDMLWKIASKYNTTYQELAEMNKIENVHLIYAGDTILVPAN